MVRSFITRAAVRWLSFTAFFALAAVSVQAAGKSELRVAYAGSMGAVMDRGLGPAFAQSQSLHYQGIGQGSYGLAHLIAARQVQADVFVVITPGPVRIVQKAGLLEKAVPVASTQMVIAYSPKSRFANLFHAAAEGRKSWYQVLEHKDVRFGRTNPATDPQGRNIILMMQLASDYYHQPGLVKRILGSIDNSAQIFAEPSLLSRLESGQLDASSGYLSATISHHLPYIKLPDAINLSDPAMQKKWYSKAGFKLDRPQGQAVTARVQPLVFYAGVLKNARHPREAKAFVQFLQSGAGQRILGKFGYSAPKGPPLVPSS